ncbi:hypothetical protein [Methylobacterium thuringiense]|uniref:hypothetical protein n=1 Tax=Methylobacterium thuringiense TaxID=1003091 RepID=UPI001EDFFD95|nr:hypothetical protein [Methylobacterium thuringiense]
MSDCYTPVSERCEQQASLMTDEGRDEAATVLWEADALIRALEIENGRLRHAVVIADLQIGDGHIEASRRTLHAALDDAPHPAVKTPAELQREAQGTAPFIGLPLGNGEWV